MIRTLATACALALVCAAAAHAQSDDPPSARWEFEVDDGFAAAMLLDAESGDLLAEFFCEEGTGRVEIALFAFAPEADLEAEYALRLANGVVEVDVPARAVAARDADAFGFVASADASDAFWRAFDPPGPLAFAAAGYAGQAPAHAEGFSAMRAACAGG